MWVSARDLRVSPGCGCLVFPAGLFTGGGADE